MAETRYETVIGLEVHAQLLTRSKIYCGCPTVFGAEPNTQVCPVCLGLPGALPVLNREAVSMALLMAIATNCRVAPRSVFARKNYFYPDCPKNYQISMYDKPLCTDGWLEFEIDGAARRVRIERIHLEDDAGKLVHGPGGRSLVDFNRCGVPLIEIVSRPDIRSPEEASRYLIALRQLVRRLGICDGNMEEGSLRCDVNISVRPEGTEKLGTKTEIKNLNSFKAVEMGIRFEIDRQIGVLRSGGRITQVTNLWDSAEKRLMVMRTKEYAHDYRYFPEPDLLPLSVDERWIEDVRATLPELPLERERRLRAAYGLTPYESGVLCAEDILSEYFEAVVRSGSDPKQTANWILRDVMEAVNEGRARLVKSESGDPVLRAASSDEPAAASVTMAPRALGSLISMVMTAAISGTAGRDVFKEMLKTGENADAIVKRLGLAQVSASDDLERWIDEVIVANPDEAARYRSGKTQLLGFFVGQVMKKSGGKANPKITGDLVRKRLES